MHFFSYIGVLTSFFQHSGNGIFAQKYTLENIKRKRGDSGVKGT
ncbi:predicted protein [Listeria monocytogenes J2818]|nr:predicted protein [Listeria monocytogenes J2818]